MPLHLPAVSRRDFLRGTVATSAAWLTLDGANLSALTTQGKRVDPHRWALLSDTHISANTGEVVRGVKMAENLSRVRDEVLAQPALPAGLLINGDCAYLRGEAADYQALAGLLNPFNEAGLPVHMTLGNHDNRDVFWEVLAGYKFTAAPLASRHLTMIDAGRANLLLLDSLDQVNQTPGKLGEEQLAWLARALDQHAGKPAIVISHHYPERPDRPGEGLAESPALFDMLLPRKHVKAWIYGHSHAWDVQQRDGLHLVNLPPVAYIFQPDRPNGWVELELAEQGATLHLHTLDPQHELAGKQVALEWRG